MTSDAIAAPSPSAVNPLFGWFMQVWAVFSAEAQKLRHIAFHAGAIDEHQSQRDPVEVESGQALLRRKLGAAIGVGRLRREILGERVVRGSPGLRPDR